MVQELGFQALLHDQENQDEGFAHTSIPWKNHGLGLNLHSMLYVIYILRPLNL